MTGHSRQVTTRPRQRPRRIRLEAGERRHAALSLGLLVLALWLASCGPVPIAVYAESLGQDPGEDGSPWGSFQVGKKVFVTGSAEACEATTGRSLDELDDGASEPLVSGDGTHLAELWEIVDASVVAPHGAAAGWMALLLRDEGGNEKWVRLPGGRPTRCVWPATDDAVALHAETQRSVVFAPHRRDCTHIEASGVAPAAPLIESEAGVPMQAAGMAMLPSRPGDESGGFAPWVRLNNGTLWVRADTFRNCFLEAKQAAAQGQPDAASLLHIDPARCSSSEEDGQPHLLCATSVGVWEGLADDSRVSLELRRRTLGAVHFLGGRPVTGSRWAKAVVSVATGERSDTRKVALYGAIEPAVAEQLSAAEGEVRVVQATDPSATYRVVIEVADLTIGQLEVSSTNETSQYKSGERQVPNPEKKKARQRVNDARQAVQKAREDYESDRRTWTAAMVAAERTYNTCVSSCSRISDASMRANCKSGCELGKTAGSVAGVITEPTENGIHEAEAELQVAETNEAETPDTVTEDVMSDWAYTKQVFARKITATLRVSMQATGGKPIVEDIPVSHRWEDFEVRADPAHNVRGHAANRGPIEHEDALLPYIARLTGRLAARHVRVALSRASLEQLRRTFTASGQTSKPGFEDVDALALDVAGTRLRRAAQQGSSVTPADGAPAVLPSSAVELARNECLLAVAVADDSSHAVAITAVNDRYADHRGRAFAAVEVCAGELSDSVVRDAAVTNSSGAKVRWGLYVTSATQPSEEAAVAPRAGAKR